MIAARPRADSPRMPRGRTMPRSAGRGHSLGGPATARVYGRPRRFSARRGGRVAMPRRGPLIGVLAAVAALRAARLAPEFSTSSGSGSSQANVNESRRPSDLAKLPDEREGLAVRRLHGDAVGAARARLQVQVGRREGGKDERPYGGQDTPQLEDERPEAHAGALPTNGARAVDVHAAGRPYPAHHHGARSGGRGPQPTVTQGGAPPVPRSGLVSVLPDPPLPGAAQERCAHEIPLLTGHLSTPRRVGRERYQLSDDGIDVTAIHGDAVLPRCRREGGHRVVQTSAAPYHKRLQYGASGACATCRGGSSSSVVDGRRRDARLAPRHVRDRRRPAAPARARRRAHAVAGLVGPDGRWESLWTDLTSHNPREHWDSSDGAAPRHLYESCALTS